MDGEIQIASGKKVFRFPDGNAVTLDIIDACMECNAIRERTKDGAAFAWLDEFRAWIEKAAAVALSRGDAYELWNAIHVAHHRSEKLFMEALELPSSTGSGPAI